MGTIAARKLVEVPPQPRWFFTTHALDRMGEMSLDREQIVDIINDPDISYPSDGRRIAKKGEHAVVYDGERIVTVLLNQYEKWQRGT